LRIPPSGGARLPAVIIVNSAPGFDGRGTSYAEELNRAGIATLEVDFMQGRGQPASPRQHMAHAFQSLERLASDPRIDGARVGIMGFSWGGFVTLLTSSEALVRQYASGQRRFAAHLGIYPICWRHELVLLGKDRYLEPEVYRRVTGRPVHILAGERDDYDEPDSCARFLAALPADARAHFSLTMYPGATFAWDSRASSVSWHAGGRKGKGGMIHIVADEALAKRSREFAVAFFRENLAGAVR
jgi:dienelactone hydrolase